MEKADWGYYWDGYIYSHFKKRPKEDMLKYFPRVCLSLDYEIAEGMVRYNAITIQNSYTTRGGSSSEIIAEPIFEWQRIK